MRRKSSIRIAPPRITSADSRRVPPPPKIAGSIYATPEYRAWRESVIRQAGGQCEWVENGRRCSKGEPKHRLFADHVTELRDGGAAFDPRNGQALCGAHHTIKTARARAARLR